MHIKRMVISGCSAWLALACSGTSAGTGESDAGWGMAAGGTVEVSFAGSSPSAVGSTTSYAGGASQGASTGYAGGPVAAGGGMMVPDGGGQAAAGGAMMGPMSGGGSVATGGAETGGSMAAGGTETGGYGAGPAVDPNSCSHDVARCFDAAAACFEYSPWSDCDQIVDVCSAMEAQCAAVGGMPGVGGTGGSSN
jgi:hypothetical protein